MPKTRSGNIISHQTTKTERIIFSAVLIVMIASFFYALIRVFFAPTSFDPDNPLTKSDYILMTLQSFGGIIVLLLPTIIEKQLHFEIPSVMHIILILFIFAAVFLGEFRRFYFHVPNWDKMLHLVSGGILAIIAFTVISLLNDMDIIHMNPLFVAIFSFCFALALGALWEIYEFIWDATANLNMQKYADQYGNDFIGRAALADTMWDLIIDAIGALTISVIGFIAVKYDFLWIHKVIIKKRTTQNENEEKVDD